MKRIISCLLAIILLVSASFETSVIAAAEDEPTFTAPTFIVSHEKADPGENVSVKIRIANNPGIASIKLKVRFDNDLILNKVTYNKELGGMSQQPQTLSSPVTLNWFNGAADTAGDMTYTVLDFTVAEGASVGEHAVTVTYDEDDVYNIAEDNIAFDISDGGVNVVISVSGLALNQTAATVKTGDGTFTLTPIFTPSNATDQKVLWESSDESVATVDGGVVTLLKKGETVITVISDDGGFEASCTLTVLCSHLVCDDIPADPSTCIKQGHGAYTICRECGEIVSGSDALLPYAEHQFTEDPQPRYLKSSATCISPAIYYKSCSVCGLQGTETFMHGAADPDNHVGSTHPENQEEASCSKPGYTGDVICDSCGEMITRGSVIGKIAHTPGSPVKESIIPASCERSGGYYEVVYCSVCGEELNCDWITIPALGHSLTLVPGNPATCTESGNIPYYVCGVCDKWYADASGAVEITDKASVVIPAAGHKPVTDEAVEPDCTHTGLTEGSHCSVCNEVLTAQKTISALGHSYGEPKWTWHGYDSATAAFSCIRGDDESVLEAEITSEVTKEPSLTEKGTRDYTAAVTFRNKVYTDIKTEVIPRWYIIGDVDCDGEVEISDVTWIQRQSAGIEIPFTLYEAPADVDCDGEVTLMDASYIQYYLAYMKTEFNIGKLVK